MLALDIQNEPVREKHYLIYSILFILPCLLLAVFIYLPVIGSKVVALNAIVFSFMPAAFMCDFLLNNSRESIFAFCGPDVVYLKIPSVIILSVSPSIYFLFRYVKSKNFKSQWK